MAKRKRDYYLVLGVPKDASDADLKRAFRELARKHHPDVNHDADAGEKFREINEAYAVLSVTETRTRYDRWGHTGEDAGGSGLGAMVDAAQEMINDVLRRRRGKVRGRDLRYTLEVSFEDAALGASKSIHVPDVVSGKTREFTVVIPPATKEGSIKMIKGEGEAGRGGAPNGDLHVIVRVADHAAYRRDGYDIHSDHVVSFTQAALGAVIEVSTIDGPVKMRIPEGTQPARMFRIRNKGVPHAAGKTAARGDHLVHIQVEVPTELSARQRELLEELAAISGEDRPGAPGGKRRLLDRVRSLLDE